VGEDSQSTSPVKTAVVPGSTFLNSSHERQLIERVFRAFHETNGAAACKVVNLFVSPSLGVGTPNVKELQKEVQVHKSMKNPYILEFLHSEILEKEKEKEGYMPGLYLLLELAVGGDLFDKIGTCNFMMVSDNSARCWDTGRTGQILFRPDARRNGKSPL
jgi:hypothetical protein